MGGVAPCGARGEVGAVGTVEGQARDAFEMDRCRCSSNCRCQEGGHIRFHGMTHLELALLEEWMRLDCLGDEIDGSGCGTSGSVEPDGGRDC